MKHRTQAGHDELAEGATSRRPFPEGITTDREGNVYVVTVAANKPRTSEETLLVLDPQGKHLRTVGIKGSGRLLLDVAFHPQTGKLLVVDYGAGKALSVNHNSGPLPCS